MFAQPAIIRQPRERPFDQPTHRQQLEALHVVISLDDLQDPSAEAGNPVDQLSRITTAGPDSSHLGRTEPCCALAKTGLAPSRSWMFAEWTTTANTNLRQGGPGATGPQSVVDRIDDLPEVRFRGASATNRGGNIGPKMARSASQRSFGSGRRGEGSMAEHRAQSEIISRG